MGTFHSYYAESEDELCDKARRQSYTPIEDTYRGPGSYDSQLHVSVEIEEDIETIRHGIPAEEES